MQTSNVNAYAAYIDGGSGIDRYGSPGMSVSSIKMPQLGESVTEGTVERWLKATGDFVRRDEPLVEVVTDKVNAEIPSPFEGKLVKISALEGTTVAVGSEIAQIEVDRSDTVTIAQVESAPERPTAVDVQKPPEAELPASTGVRASPAARRLAEENGVDISSLSGTGPGGRVTREDVVSRIQTAIAETGKRPVEANSAGLETTAETDAPMPEAASARQGLAGEREEVVRITAVRRAIAEHMVRSLKTSPHVWLLVEVDMTSLVRYREAAKDVFLSRQGVSLTYLPFVSRVLCKTLREFPYLNSSWTDDGIVLKKDINLGLAVAVPPDGLIVPVVKDADQLGFIELVRTISDLTERARTKRLKPEEVQGGTFTINNTGATGSIASQPIINQPQAAILTTELIVRRPVVFGEGIAIRHMMNMCLSFDHRIFDGRMAGLFMNSIKRRLEEWSSPDIEA